MDERKKVVDRFWEEMCSGDNFDEMDGIFASGYVLHDLVNGKDRSADELRNILSDVLSALPGLRVSIEDQVSAEEDKVVTRFEIRVPGQGGTEAASPERGGELALHGISISRIRQNKIEESWLVWEALRAEQEIEPDVQVWWWPPWRR